MELTLAQLHEMGSSGFPGLLGIEVYEAGDGLVRARLELLEKHQSTNVFLHAGAVVGLAYTAAGYGCILSLPDDAKGFTTIELKTNFLRSAWNGTIECQARRLHNGRTTQVWDADVTDPEGRTMALLRATQLILR
jgi:uncharacterized protein (TIGR00369 family)